jgi:hypothetical protein
LEPQELLGCRELLVLLVVLGLLEPQDYRGRQVFKAILVRLEQQGLKVLQGLLERQVQQDYKVLQV